MALRCVTERRQILPAARGLGFLSRPGQYAAALRAALEIHRRSVAQPGLSSGLREALRAGEGWLEQELRFL
ncbi:MAG TPA: hypothetical protein ENI90_09305 [Methylothermaceae bacterium]|nr:hypothetical protein [Methylothermaceae bacterium]